MSTAIKTCDCKHEFQDKKYGEGKRVHNLVNKDGTWRCTVCSKIRK
jgi:hypothetical protein